MNVFADRMGKYGHAFVYGEVHSRHYSREHATLQEGKRNDRPNLGGTGIAKFGVRAEDLMEKENARDVDTRNSSSRATPRGDGKKFIYGIGDKIFDTIREPLLVLDVDLGVKAANRSFYHIFRTNPGQTEGRKVYQLGTGQWDVPKLRELLEAILPNCASFDGYEVDYEFPLIGRKNFLLNARQVVSDPGAEHFILVAFEDVTDHRLVTERERAIRSRDEFIGIVSHELKNPLAAMTITLDYLKRTIPPVPTQEKLMEMIERVRSSADRLRRIVGDLMDVTQIESRRFSVEKSGVDVHSLVEEVRRAFEQSAQSRDIRISTTVSPECRSVLCDRGRILQVLSNLVDNAIKFSKCGGSVEIEVDRAEGKIKFSVKDSGKGIAPEELSHIFEKFWQADSGSRRLGAGLGLYVARGIIDSHQGKIWVESELGSGTKFIFELPE